MRRGRAVVGLVVVGAIVVASWIGVSSLRERVSSIFTPDRCTATVDGHTATLDPEQAQNAALIAAVSVERGMPARAASIALATALQESKLRNLDNGDRDSLGLFQQRPSQGWGTPAEIMNPVHATNAFYDALDRVDGYDSMDITQAAQDVQHSGFPTAYAGHEADARTLASALTGNSPAAFTCRLKASSTPLVGNPSRRANHVEREVRALFDGADTPVTGRVSGRVLELSPASGSTGRTTAWAVAAYVVAQSVRLHVTSVSLDGRSWTLADSGKGWVADSGSPAGRRVTVEVR